MACCASSRSYDTWPLVLLSATSQRLTRSNTAALVVALLSSICKLPHLAMHCSISSLLAVSVKCATFASHIVVLDALFCWQHFHGMHVWLRNLLESRFSLVVAVSQCLV